MTLLTTAAGTVLAEQDSLRTTTLENVTITAKSKARQQSEQAFAVNVVDMKGEYAKSKSLNKILENVSSVKIRETGGLGSDFNFALNGFSGNQVKFFIDGVPMDNFGSSFNLATLTANMADYVEVYKGSLPVTLSADALGGAVNIVTRRNANYVDAAYSYGSFNTHRASVNGAYTDHKTGFTLKANAFLNYSDNNYKVYAPIVDLATGLLRGEEWVKRFNDGYLGGGVRMETGLVGKSWADYALLTFIASGDSYKNQTGATMDAVYGKPKTNSLTLVPGLKYKKRDLLTAGLDLEAYLNYAYVNTHNVDTAALRYNWLGEYVPAGSRGEGYLTDAKIRMHQWQGDVSLSYLLGEHNRFLLNHLVSSNKRISDDQEHKDNPMNNVPQYLTKNITGLSYQLRYNRWNMNVFGKLYHLNTSSNKLLDQFLATERWETVKASQTNWGYGAAGTYFFQPWLQGKVSFEQAYRMPEAVEMFGDGFIQKSNTDLRPEMSRNLNIGLMMNRQVGKHNIAAEVNYIYRNTRDFILKGVNLTSDPTTSYENIGKAVTHGVEGSLRYDYKKTVHVGGSITYQDIRDKEEFVTNNNSYVGEEQTANVSYGQRMPNIPYFFLNANAGYDWHNAFHKGNTLSVEYSMNYTYEYYLGFPGLGRPSSKKMIPTQTVHNISVGYTMANGRYSIFAECNNIGNELLFDNYRLQKPGRNFNVTLRVYLPKM